MSLGSQSSAKRKCSLLVDEISPLHSLESLSALALWLLKSPHTRNERIENDGEHTIHSNDDLRHSAHCVSVRSGPDDQMGWTYLESHRWWYGRRRSRESGQCRFQPGRISTSPDRQARGKMDCRGVVYDRQYGIWDVPVGYPGRRLHHGSDNGARPLHLWAHSPHRRRRRERN